MARFEQVNAMRRAVVGLAAAMLSLSMLSSPAQAADPISPDKLVDSVAKQLLTDLSAHRDEYRKDPSQVRKMVDKYLLPHFDTEYAARIVLAKHWRTATPEQRKQFVDAFYQSLLSNYGSALLDFTPDKLKILPYRENPDDKGSATVRTEIRRSNGAVVPVNYSLHKVNDAWKAWDVTIEGVSYVKSFRTDFGSEIDQKGLDAVIKRLQSQPDAPVVKKGA